MERALRVLRRELNGRFGSHGGVIGARVASRSQLGRPA
jgi:hypothetical protein